MVAMTGEVVRLRTLVVVNDPRCPLGGLEGPVHRAGPVSFWSPEEPGERPSVDDHDAVVALGGRQGPWDDERHPWLAQERRLLRDAVDRGLAVLGICLGGELLAQVLGAEVGALDVPEVGWCPLGETPAAAHDPLLSQVDPTAVMQWHSFGFGAPAGAVVLAGAADRVAAFRHGARAWALQFHVEATAPLVHDWADPYAAERRRDGVDATRLRADTEVHAAGQRRAAARVGLAFVEAAGQPR